MSPKNAAKVEQVEDQVPEVESVETPAAEAEPKPKLQLVISGDAEQVAGDEMPGLTVQQPVSSVQTAKFSQLSESRVSMDQNSMDLLLDVDLDLSVELGRANVPVREVLQLGSGSIVELNKLAGDPVDVLVNGRLIARGEVVVVDENFGVRITEIMNPSDRISRLG